MVEVPASPRSPRDPPSRAGLLPSLSMNENKGSGEQNMMRTVSRTLSIGPSKVIKVTYQTAETSPLGSSPTKQDSNMAAVGKAWQRKILADLQDATHFSATELQVLLRHFTELQSADDRLDKATFFKYLNQAFGTTEQALLQHIYSAMDEQEEGWVSFKQLACALSTVFRGDKEDILEFWFRMYDQDKDGFLTKQDFQDLLQDVNTVTRKAMAVYVDQVFAGGEDAEDGSPEEQESEVMLSFEEFKAIMEDYDVIPMFANPHKSAQHKQQPAFRQMTPAEREVLLLLGTELQARESDLLINENAKSHHFYFILEGVIQLERGGVELGVLEDGSFMGEAALFEDVKQQDSDGAVTFTTAARVVSETVRVLQLNIHDFYPLVYHEHPGATAIVQRLGRIMLERFQQTEERLQAILAGQQRQSEAGMRLSSKDWAAFRKRLTRQWALKYHKIGRRGKLEIVPTKLMGTKEDLSVAYSPGVAEPCVAIQSNERWAYEYTAKGHLVGVLTNGTAVLGLGNIGPLAGKPVMEGKAVLFKKFADLDAFDVEIQEQDPDQLIKIICALEPTFGGINLEDIKAPECFRVERECQAKCNIPVFHDDQHGTAIIAGAGLLNALELVHKNIADIKVCVCGCGAAGYTCAKYFVSLGVRKENVIAVDVQGVVYSGRADLTPDNYLSDIAIDTPKRSLSEAVAGTDVFLGLSAGNLLSPEMLLSMARDPVVFACANPVPEIDPDVALATRSDVIMCTGRSDFPNQINNVCAFPYIFRGALDCRARAVNEQMKLAATHAIAALAKRPPQVKRRHPSAADLGMLESAYGLGAISPSESSQQDEAVADAVAKELEHELRINSSSTASSSAASSRKPPPAPSAGSSHSSNSAATRTPSPGRVASQRHASPSRHRRHRSENLSTPEKGLAAEQAKLEFGRRYIIPKPFDERLLPEVATAVVEAAIATGVARLADLDIKEYRRGLVDLAMRINM